MQRRVSPRRGWTLLLSALLLSAATSTTAMAGGFGWTSLVPGPVIRIDGRNFTDEVFGKGAWVAGVLSDVEYVETQNRPNGGFGGGRLIDAHVYRVRLTVSKRLFCRDPLPPKFAFAEVRIPLSGYWDGDRYRRPQNGDRVFAEVRQTESGQWECRGIGIPLAGEYALVDRVQSILYEGSSRQAVEQLLAGCCDDDPAFAVWCMNALNVFDDDDTGTQQEVYGRFRDLVTVDRYREALITTLESRATPREPFIHAAVIIRNEWMPPDEEERFHQANYQRIRDHFARPHEPLNNFEQNELSVLLSWIYIKANERRRREVLAILIKQADNPILTSRAESFRWAAELYSTQDEDLNAAIFRYYRDHAPLRPQNREEAVGYWSGLFRFMFCETHRKRKADDAGLDILEQKWPLASQEELPILAHELNSYLAECVVRLSAEDWRLVTLRLKTLYGISATEEQRQTMSKCLRDRKIPLPQDLAT